MPLAFSTLLILPATGFKLEARAVPHGPTPARSSAATISAFTCFHCASVASQMRRESVMRVSGFGPPPCSFSQNRASSTIDWRVWRVIPQSS